MKGNTVLGKYFCNCHQSNELRLSNTFFRQRPKQAPQSRGLPPEIVGEGEVASVILPDGTFQYFFTPTVQWTRTNTYPPHYFNANNTNYYSTDLGVWFIRSINNPIPAYTTNSYLCNRALMSAVSSDHSLNPFYPGYQLKFHNDNCTSTTDIHYFYPCLRQFDCTLSFPSRGCAAVQIDTPLTHTTCHCEVLCSKPCQCNAVHHLPKPPSAMSLTNSYQTKHVICQNAGTSQSSYTDTQQKHLLQSDVKNKRIKLQRKSLQNSWSNDNICQCPTRYYDKSTVTYTDSCNGGSPKMDIEKETQLSQKRLEHEWKDQNTSKRESKEDYQCCYHDR